MSDNAAGGQKLLFAPRGNQYNEDFDISEVFADYFTTEFEDPLNAYTSSMANYAGGAASVALGQQQQQQEEEQQNNNYQQQLHNNSTSQSSTGPQNNFPSATTPATTTTTNSAVILPTGRGIKTAWHTGAMPSLASSGTYQQSQGQQSFAPLSKKPKFAQEATTTTSSSSSTLPLTVPQQSQQPQTSIARPSGGSALSGRLGFSMTGGQVNIPHRVQQQNPPPTAPPPSASKSLAPLPVMSLPVGVGIRLGGIGGVVHPGQTTSGGGVHMTHTQWSNTPGGSKLAHVQHAPTSSQYNPVTGQYNMQWPGMPGGYGNESEVGMSETAIAERRQRNREHAKRSRVRKKFMLESLQEQVRALQKENVELRMIVQEKIPHRSQQIIDACCTKSPLFEDDPHKGTKDAKKEVELVNSDFSLITSLTSGQQNFVLSDPRLPDNPIVYASQGFYDLTGYSREQVLGRNCRFLQGPGTDPRAVDVIRTAIANGTDCTVCLLNYKADGTPFWNQFFIAALRDSDNCIVNYVGVQCHIEPEAGASALEEKVNAVMPLQIKNGGDEEEEDES